MGKRKERRLAAKTASNRRVKLDLIAEPSGDFGDSSSKEEVGGGGNTISHAESPNSPSSSESQHVNKICGQTPENPLLLLGQYSDEEAEEESGKEISCGNEENTPAELDEQQVNVDNHEGTAADEDENLTADKVDQQNKDPSSSLDVLPKMEENGVIENNTAESLQRNTDPMEQGPLTSDTQATGDVDSGWKMVLHEESNSYYYWNVVTGETSWEVPVVLTKGNESAYDPKSAQEVEEQHATNAMLDSEMDPYNGSTNVMAVEATDINGSRSGLEVRNENDTKIKENDKEEGNHVNTIDGVNDGFTRQFDDTLTNGEVNHSDYCIHEMRDHVNQRTVGGDPSSDSSRLVELGESLLQRLKSLKGSEGFNDQISKLMFELDIRIADIKSLVPYGSSLLPFWLHSENQLKNLEASINNEVLKCSQFANIGEMNEAENKSNENIYEADAIKKNSEFDAENKASTSKETVVEGHENAIPADNSSNVEDVDMDMEMEVEVEDEIPFEDESRVQNRPQMDQFIPPIPHEQNESCGSEEQFEVPPPPNDEWVPPPPPDDEPLPPPPPDEPPEAPVPPPPSDMQTAQGYPYGEQQYSFAYPGSTFDYYGQTNTDVVPSNSYYVDANGCQVAAPVPTLYYEPVTYYTLQEGIASGQPSSSQVDVAAVNGEIGKLSTPATSTVTHNVSVVSAPTVATKVAPAEPAPKVQPKVSRNKKRTVASVPTLRSNKKVSGLVDKWKAVKEELHEDEEDEPENAYEVLEKKRQREIEQWIAQQIATGEAKDNANFQPLGGDWRERVRRKRAKKSTEAEENLAKPIDDTNKQPDLVELSKQLPSGWQAYWDESSKQVYYGNSTTSETTWSKPTI